MRQIKFRGKDVKTGEWRYGYYAVLHTANFDPHGTRADGYKISHSIFNDEEGERSNGGYWKEVDGNTVGQYIGLRDKKYVEIYDGDILHSEFSDGSHTRFLVGWNEEEACFGIMDEYAYREKQKGYDYPRFYYDLLLKFRMHGERFEVIGNIHDTPELLNNRS